MGTRHLICVWYKGEFLVAQYGQWDGYPEGQGVRVWRFLRDPANVQRLKDGLAHVYTPTDEDLRAMERSLAGESGPDSLAGFADDFTRRDDRWVDMKHYDKAPAAIAGLLADDYRPSVHRECSAAVLEVVAQGTAERKTPIVLDLGFANNPLFCEWAYVIDLDAGVLEVYHGGVKKHEGHRFESVGGENDPVVLLGGSYEFAALRAMESDEAFVEQVSKDVDAAVTSVNKA